MQNERVCKFGVTMSQLESRVKAVIRSVRLPTSARMLCAELRRAGRRTVAVRLRAGHSVGCGVVSRETGFGNARIRRYSRGTRARPSEAPMHRRSFVRLRGRPSGIPSPAAARGPVRRSLPEPPGRPALRVVSNYAAAAVPGMPGPYPGRVVSVKSDKCVDTATGRANDEVVREMMAQGMRALTGAGTTADAWRRFFEPSDVVGIKVNCGGYPFCVSAYEIVGRNRPPAHGGRRAGVADLRLRAVSESARRGELRAASARKACRSSPPNAPTGTSTTAATIPRPTSRRISSAKRTRVRT